MKDLIQQTPEFTLRPTIAEIINDTQILKLAEIMKNKSSESPYAFASLLSALKAVLGKPYLPKTILGSGKTLAFNYKGQSYIIEFNCPNPSPEEQASGDSEVEMEVDTTITQMNNGLNRAQLASFPPPQLIKPYIGDILTDDQFLLLVKLIKEKVNESPRKFACLLAVIKAVLDDIGLKSHLSHRKVIFFHGNETALQEYVVEFEDDQQSSPPIPVPTDCTNNGVQRLSFVMQPILTTPINNGNGFVEGSIYNVAQEAHEPDEDMDELAKDEIVVDDHPINNDMWRHAHLTLQPPHHPHHNTITPINKRKRASSTNSEEDNFIHHTAPNAQSAKRRTPEKHKAPPLSCEAVKKLFITISKPTLIQRLEESKALIAAIKDTYNTIHQSAKSAPVPTSPRLNLLCHLLQSPPTSRIDGISSKVFSNLELYKLFTTYNAYKDELGQKNQSGESANNTTLKRTNPPNPDPSSPLPYPTYSSFIDPTVTLHIKDQTGGKEVGKHRLNCAWRLSILCELLGQGVLLMTKELSGAKLERILVEEFSKLIEFLKNPDNHDWVASVREKLDLIGFDEVYAPLAEAPVANGNNSAAFKEIIPVEPVVDYPPVVTDPSVSPQQANGNEIILTNEIGMGVPFEQTENHPSQPTDEGEEEEEEEEPEEVAGENVQHDVESAVRQIHNQSMRHTMTWIKTEAGRRY
ncbi:hypothetical protein G9A89_010913 [Geosiphon pyriformis]|nr:hypothetical protein G9A89_010913 [Geosiphon pyriformis]